MKKTLGIFALVVLISACGKKDEIHHISGNTMGTMYHISFIAPRSTDMSMIEGNVAEALLAVNRSMSLFDKTSELSRFNATPKDDTFCPSDAFMKVFAVSQDIFRATGGAWDGTVGPLVNLWGFGNAKDTPKIPSDDQIRNIVGLVGFDKISVVDGHCLKKAADGLVLDLGSIAKGYGVDVVCDALKKNGIDNYLVEIGGEVRGSGKKIDHPWRVGINTPSFSAPLNQVCTQIELTDRAVATSGDYRNFKTENGKRYSHEIDPKTGRPVENNVASVSVIADTTVYADGLATGLMILGAEKGVALVNSLGNVACLFIVRDEKGAFKMVPSDRWPVKNP